MARRKIKQPDDFKTVADFLEYVRKTVTKDSDADQFNREAGAECARFFVGEQWDPEMRTRREADGKPALVINRAPAFVGQITNNRRLNQTSIRVIPDNGGVREVAEIRQGLIRSIEKTSKADRAYDKALENCVIAGIGNVEVVLQYADNDVFEQDIVIRGIPNPFSVIWDRLSTDPTGRDARHCAVLGRMSRDEFKKMYPDATPGDIVGEVYETRVQSQSAWLNEDDVTVTTFWRMRSEKRLVALLDDGSVQDITDMFVEVEQEGPDGVETVNTLPAEIDQRIVRRQDGEPIVRETDMRYAEMYLLTSMSLLEGPYRLPISRLPVLRVPGWMVNVGDQIHRFGLLQFMKDPMRIHNYFRSVLVEKLMQAPKPRWVATAASVAGREIEWRSAHIKDDPLLIHNDDAPAPQFVAPVQVEPALVQISAMTVQDLKDVSNIHDASLGIQSNEVSGKAIGLRQQQGELATVIYHDNLNAAIEECGEVINQLIPVVYDTPRVIKVLGTDDKEQLVAINGFDESALDITTGKYSVSVVTGPSYATKRMEAAESMMGAVNAMPEVMAVAADLIVKNFDWPGADDIAKRLKTKIAPEEMTDDMSPEEQAQRKQQQQEQAALQQRAAELEFATKEAEVREKQARAQQAAAQAEKTLAEIDLERAKLALEAEKLQTDFEMARMDRAIAADQADREDESSNDDEND